jgi:hypothetical protein
VAALVTGGVLAGFDEQDEGVKWLGEVALIFWAAAVFTFMWAISRGFEARFHWITGDGHATQIMDTLRAQERAVNRTIRIGLTLSSLAGMITVFALGFALFLGKPDKNNASGTLAFHMRAGKRIDPALRSVCPNLPANAASLSGTLDRSTLDDAFVALKVAAGTCSKQEVQLRIPRADVAAVSASAT